MAVLIQPQTVEKRRSIEVLFIINHPVLIDGRSWTPNSLSKQAPGYRATHCQINDLANNDASAVRLGVCH